MVKFSRYISVILLGIWAIVAQIVLIREFLVVFYGNELIFGVVMASWLVGVSLGAISAGVLSKKIKNDKPLFVFSQIIALATLPVAICLIRNARGILDVPTGLLIPFVPAAVFSFLIIAPATFAVGFCFPLAARISKNIGTAYILEGIGSFLGGAVFSFLLAGKIDHFTVIFAISGLVMFNLALLSDKSKRIIYFVTLCLFAILIFGAGWRLDTFTSKMRLKSINPKMQMLKSADSKYQNITIARLQDQLSVLGDGHFLFSFPDDYNQETFVNIVMSQHTHARSVLLIGSGIAGEIYQILKYPLEKLDFVELDPHLIRLIVPYLSKKDRDALSDERLSVFFSDGRRFVNKTQSQYDLIIVNITDASTAMLNRFYTKEFFSHIKLILKKDGVFTIGITSALNYLGPDIERYVGSIYKTLKAVFPNVVVMPGDRNQFFCSFSDEIVTTDAAVLEKRFYEKKIQSLYFKPQLFRDIFFPERVEFLKESLEKIQAPLNTDVQPISYYYNLILWNLFSGSSKINIFRDLAEVNLFKIILFALAAFLLIRLAWMLTRAILKKDSIKKYASRAQKFNSCWAIFTVGFAAMAFEIILIFSFQNIYGYVYEMIGLIIGIFMLGMILAAAFSNNILIRFQKSWVLALLMNEILIVVFAFAIPFIRILHIPFIFLAGFLTGMAFPLACNICWDIKDKDIGFAAGIIDSADLAGACLGVLLTATLLVPLLGIPKTCFVVASLNLISVILIGFSLL